MRSLFPPPLRVGSPRGLPKAWAAKKRRVPPPAPRRRKCALRSMWSHSMSRYPLRVVGEGRAPIGGCGHPSGTFLLCRDTYSSFGPLWVKSLPLQRERERIDHFRRKDSTLALISPRRKNSIMVICNVLFPRSIPCHIMTFNMPERRYNSQDVTLKVYIIASLHRAAYMFVAVPGSLHFLHT